MLDSPAKGIYGYRVTRMVGGKVYRRFFSLIDKTTRAGQGRTRRRLDPQAAARVRERALAYDAELAQMQRVNREAQAREAVPSARARPSTTVRGISFCAQRPKRTKRVPPAPGFLVSARAADGKAFTRYVPLRQPIDEAAWEDAWMRAVFELGTRKRLRDWLDLVTRMPDMKKTLALAGVRLPRR